jgi:hypothetical protein
MIWDNDFGLKTEMQHTFKIVVHFQFGEEKG